LGTYIGIDIAKASFDVVHHETKEHRKYNYTDNGVNRCLKWLSALKPDLVLMESTGGYERRMVNELMSRSVPVNSINPKRIRDFAKAQGLLAKTDRIDAFIIAQYAAVFEPQPRVHVDQISAQAADLAARRRQLIHMRTQEKNRKEHAHDKSIADSIDAVIKALDEQIKKIDNDIQANIDRLPELKEKVEILESVPGVGKPTARMLVCQLPELGLLNRREIASLVGLAPINRDSGRFRGKRMITGGRHHVRTLLYMPTMVATRYNPVIKDYYQKLVKQGKKKMVALTAAMRKMLTILNAMMANKTKWNENYS
jgi:transposase